MHAFVVRDEVRDCRESSQRGGSELGVARRIQHVCEMCVRVRWRVRVYMCVVQGTGEKYSNCVVFDHVQCTYMCARALMCVCRGWRGAVCVGSVCVPVCVLHFVCVTLCV